jgi:hypothetical protein
VEGEREGDGRAQDRETAKQGVSWKHMWVRGKGGGDGGVDDLRFSVSIS